MSREETPVGKRATELCKQFPETPSRTLAKKLAAEFKPVVTIEQARNLIRVKRGTKGKSVRTGRKKVAYKKRKAGWKPEAPPSLAEKWEPYILPGSRVLVISDLHVPYHDKAAIDSAIEYGKKLKPDTVLINGDFGDWYSLSKWQKDPRKRDLKQEIDIQRECMRFIRQSFPKTQIVFKNGNHEDRWDVYVWNHAPEICELEQVRLDVILGFAEFGIDWVTEERPIMVGKLPIFHGHELPKGMTNPVNMARGAFLRTVHTLLVAHGHRTSGHAEPDLWHEEIFCWSIGCLCDLRPKYARINKWNHGFAFVERSGKEFDVRNFRISRDGVVRSS